MILGSHIFTTDHSVDAYSTPTQEQIQHGFTDESDGRSTIRPMPPAKPELKRQKAVDPVYNEFVLHSKLDLAPIAGSSYEAKDNRVKFMQPFTKNGKYIKYMPSRSTDELAVYKEVHGSKVFIGIRGSATARDWTHTDAAILAGDIKSTSRFTSNRSQIRDIVRGLAANPEEVTLVGHSLGAHLGFEIANLDGYNATGFNAGYSPTSLVRGSDLRNDRLTSYIVPGDPLAVSGLLPFMPHTRLINRSETSLLDPLFSTPSYHSMNNFYNAMDHIPTTRDDLYGPGESEEEKSTSVRDKIIEHVTGKAKGMVKKKLVEEIKNRLRNPPLAPPGDPLEPIEPGDPEAIELEPRFGGPEIEEPILNLGEPEPIVFEDVPEDLLGLDEPTFAESLVEGLGEAGEAVETIAEFAPFLLFP